jgi:hypothetical protein
MELNDWLLITDGRVTEGSEFGWDCYGDRAYSMSYWNGLHRKDEVSTHVVYNRDTFEVYETDVFDGDKNKSYVWRDSRYAGLYKTELNAKNSDYECEWPEIELETAEDFTEKATAIMNGFEYDNRIQVPLNLDKDEVFALMVAAHERDMTFNELVALGIREAMNAELSKSEDVRVDAVSKGFAESLVGNAWPFNIGKLGTQVTWTQDSDDFIGTWNTIKEFELVDTDFGQFTGGIMSHKYDTPVYTYTVFWYGGDTEELPDEIVREDKHVE